MALIDDAKVLGEPYQPRPLPDNIVGETMQGTHPVTQARKQPHLLLQEESDSVSEVLHCRIDQRNDQYLLVFFQTRGNQLGSQIRESPGLAAAGYGSDPHAPTFIT